MGRVKELASYLDERDAHRLGDLLALERPSIAERIETDELMERLQVQCDDADAVAEIYGYDFAA